MEGQLCFKKMFRRFHYIAEIPMKDRQSDHAFALDEKPLIFSC